MIGLDCVATRACCSCGCEPARVALGMNEAYVIKNLNSKLMSGHSKWHSIKHKKAAEDKKKGKIFTKHAKLIAVAARAGGDPDMNPTLRMAIENARAENMPNDIVERAIKKGTGESKEAAAIEEVMYEGFGPGGVAIFIEALTENRHRTISNVKVSVTKNGGNMGAIGSVGYMFKKSGRIKVALTDEDGKAIGKSAEEIELAAIDAGADDVKIIDGENDSGEKIAFGVEIYTDWQKMMSVRANLVKAGIKTESATITYLPITEIEVSDPAVAEQLTKLIDAIEEDDDVSCVYSNAKILA